MTHCWQDLKDKQKCMDLVILLRKGGTEVVDLDPALAKRPRGNKSTKMEMKRDASTIALQDTLKVFITQKEKSTEKKDEREKEKRREREERDKNFHELQKKKIELDAKKVEVELTNTKTRAAEAELKAQEVEAAIMTTDLTTLTPRRRAWVEEKQRYYMERDA